MNYLDYLVNNIHSTVVATIDDKGLPQTRVIDMMHYDENGLYFLTAKGKEFYAQLTKQNFVAISATKDKRAISIRGKVKCIGKEKLDLIFDKNTYMQEIYPNDTRSALDVFCLYEGQGEFFDISNPSKIFRDTFSIGKETLSQTGYYVNDDCIGCKLCFSVCPQKCIDISIKPISINQSNCLHCGNCAEICPKGAIKKRG